MATVTGFTAERMLEMENATIIDGDIVGDDLILTKKDGTTVNAGNVRGPTGEPGVSNAEMSIHVPVGMVVDYIGIVVPTNWLGIIGQTIVNGQTLYPTLWAVLPASMKSGSSIVFPDSRGKVVVSWDNRAAGTADTDFDTVGEIGGAKTVALTQAQLPAIALTVDPPATTVVVNPPLQTFFGITSVEDTGDHVHLTTTYGSVGVGVVTTGAEGTSAQLPFGTGNSYRVMPADTVTGYGFTEAGSGTPHYHTINLQVDINPFNITVDIASFNLANLGSNQPHNNVQPYIVLMKIIKAV